MAVFVEKNLIICNGDKKLYPVDRFDPKFRVDDIINFDVSTISPEVKPGDWFICANQIYYIDKDIAKRLILKTPTSIKDTNDFCSEGFKDPNIICHEIDWCKTVTGHEFVYLVPDQGETHVYSYEEKDYGKKLFAIPFEWIGIIVE